MGEAQLFDFAIKFKKSIERQSRLKKTSSFSQLKTRPRKAHSAIPGDHSQSFNQFADVKGF